MNEAKMPKTIATINFKGGVGKTTVTWALETLFQHLAIQPLCFLTLTRKCPSRRQLP